VLAVVAVGLVVIVSVIGVLAFVVVEHYPQQRNISLDAADRWSATVCIPVPNDGSSLNVTFSWTTSNGAVVRMLEGPLFSWTYNVTAAAGTGWVSVHTEVNWAQFGAVGAPTLPEFVNITLSYDAPGHYLGGPAVDGCQ
jgi:hypothetical protein